MGLFLQTAILKDCKLSQAEMCIKKLSDDASLESKRHGIILSECELNEQHGDVFVHFEYNCGGYGDIAKALSIELENTVMLLFIYDGDFWGYILCDKGERIDYFNPVPEYFSEEVLDSEVQRCAGKSEILSKYFNVNEDAVKNYLVRWGEEVNFEQKAYEDDEYGYEDWQMVDFLTKLGYSYTEGL